MNLKERNQITKLFGNLIHILTVTITVLVHSITRMHNENEINIYSFIIVKVILFCTKCNVWYVLVGQSVKFFVACNIVVLAFEYKGVG